MKIILDLDNTIVYITSQWLDRCPDFTFRLGGGIYHMYIRPGLHNFLQFLQNKNYDIGIWTAGTRSYASSILPRIFGTRWKKELVLFYHRRQCCVWHRSYIKDLRKVKDSCMLIDDNRDHIRFKSANYLRDREYLILNCKPYYGSHADHEFQRIQRILMFCSPSDTKQFL